MHARENALNARDINGVHALQKPCEHRAVVGQDGVVAVLEEIGLVDLDLRPKDSAAIDPAAHHPIDTAMAVIGAAVAVFPERSPELRDDDDHRIAPAVRPDLLGESGKSASKLAETVCEIA